MNFGARRFSSMAGKSAFLRAARGRRADQYNRGSRPERRGSLWSHGRRPRERPPPLGRLLAVILGRRARALRDLTPVTFAVTVAGPLFAGEAREKRRLMALDHRLGHHLPAIRGGCGRGAFGDCPARRRRGGRRGHVRRRFGTTRRVFRRWFRWSRLHWSGIDLRPPRSRRR